MNAIPGSESPPALGAALLDGDEVAVVVSGGRVTRVDQIDPSLSGTDVLGILGGNHWARLGRRLHEHIDVGGPGGSHPVAGVDFAPPYRHPRMIWGIGLNYVEHARDLGERLPDAPGSFIKADHTIIGPGDPIPLPRQSRRVTTEAELGLVIGRRAQNVAEDEALDYVAGVVPILDQTAEDILEQNPRFLTRAKNFPGFFSFGPWITPISHLDCRPDLSDLTVTTIVNGAAGPSNTIAHMAYPPRFLVSFHSAVMPLEPGDIISTGTPGAVVVHDGDVATCRIDGLPELSNRVEAASA